MLLKNSGYDYSSITENDFTNNLPNFLAVSNPNFNEFPLFGDTGGGLETYGTLLLSYFPLNHPKKAQAAWLLDKIDLKDNPYTILWFNNIAQSQIPQNSALFNDKSKIAILRNSDKFLAFKSSQTCTFSHQHKDANNFVIGADKWMITDPGYDFSRYSSYWHNSFLIDNAVQDNSKGGQIIEFNTNSDYDYVVGEAKDAYPPGLISQYERNALLIKNEPSYFIIIDKLNSPVEREYKMLLQSESSIAFSNSEINLTDMQSQARIKIKATKNLAIQQSASTISITPVQKSAKETFLTLILTDKKPVNISFENNFEKNLFTKGDHSFDYNTDCSQHYSGLCSLRIDNLAADLSILTGKDLISVDLSKEYVIGANVKNSGNQKVYLGLYFLDRFKNNMYTMSPDYPDYKYYYSGTPLNNWQNIQISIQKNSMPAGTAYAQLFFIGGDHSTGSTWWDNLVFQQTGDSPADASFEEIGDIIKVNYKGNTDYILFNPDKTLKTFSLPSGKVTSDALACIVRGIQKISYKGSCY